MVVFRHRLLKGLAVAGVLAASIGFEGMPPPGGAPVRSEVTLAVVAFENNTGQARYDPLGKGLANMMTSDLSAVPELRLVEREQLQALIEELELQQTEYFDSTTALQVGMFVGADHVVVGSIAAVSPQVRLDTRVVHVESGRVVQTATVTGHEDDLFDLQQRLAASLIEGIDVVLTPEGHAALQARQEANRMDDIETMLLYSEALDLYDRGDYVGALERLNEVRQRAPSSQLVSAAVALAQERAEDRVEEEVRGRINRFLRGN
jgi:TolB-like protein